MSHNLTQPTAVTTQTLLATDASGNTKSLLALPAPDLYSVKLRGGLRTYRNAPAAYYAGDGRPSISPITLTLLVEAADENAAVRAATDLVDFLSIATTLTEPGVTAYRALQGDGYGVQAFLPEPIGNNYAAWQVQAILLPLFARPTTVATRDEATYQANLLTGSWVGASDPSYELVTPGGTLALNVQAVRDLGGTKNRLELGQGAGMDLARPTGFPAEQVRPMQLEVLITAANRAAVITQFYALIDAAAAATELTRTRTISGTIATTHRALLGLGASVASATLDLRGATEGVAKLTLWPSYARPTAATVTTLSEYQAAVRLAALGAYSESIIPAACTGANAFSDGFGFLDGTCWTDD